MLPAFFFLSLPSSLEYGHEYRFYTLKIANELIIAILLRNIRRLQYFILSGTFLL